MRPYAPRGGSVNETDLKTAIPDIVADAEGSYLSLSDGEFRTRISAAYARMSRCDLCPRRCGANRLAGEIGVCGAGLRPRVFVSNLHHGEEPPVSGTRGSGAVFLSGCNMNCCYCQNYPLSQLHHGSDGSIASLASALLELQARGAHNINFVTPSHQVPQLLAAVYAARKLGLHLPLVYNTSSYDEISTLMLLDGVIDIYLADFRYTDEHVAARLSGVRNYVESAKNALIEMHRQVGDITMDRQGRYVPRGVIVRYLILPRHSNMARSVFDFVAHQLSPETYVSIMTQYFPAYKALDASHGIERKVTEAEFERVMRAWTQSGLQYGWMQDLTEEGRA